MLTAFIISAILSFPVQTIPHKQAFIAPKTEVYNLTDKKKGRK